MKIANWFCWSKKKKSSNYRTNNNLKMTDFNPTTPTEVYEGQLSKYTNVVKGWQYRWFILDPKTGFLNYFLMESEKSNRPRGRIHLNSAQIAPSDEDSNSFTVKPKIGEVFKLRAQDAKIRQEWVNRLRGVSEYFAVKFESNQDEEKYDVNPPSTSAVSTVIDAFNSVKGYLDKAERSSMLLSQTIDDLPTSGQVTHSDKDILMLKAASQSTVTCLNQCYNILKHLSNDNPSDVVNRDPMIDMPHSSKKMLT